MVKFYIKLLTIAQYGAIFQLEKRIKYDNFYADIMACTFALK